MPYTAYRTQLKLNNAQRELMAKHAGFARWVYNWGLKLWGEAYKHGLKPGANALKKVFTNHVKPQFAWVGELSSRVYQYAFISLGDAFKRFFQKLGGYPNFKKKGLHDSFTLDNTGRPIRIGGLRHKLPFIGWVRTHEALPEYTPKKVTISKQAGDWYLSFHVEMPSLAPTPKTVDVVGVDLGISSLAILSTGVVFPSSQLCSCCGVRQRMPLNVRVYECFNCELVIDRDLNAAINFSNWGRLVPGSLLRVNRSHAPFDAENKPHCSDKSCNVSVL
jgi:putative transposase